jgi:hypothetical protein
VDLSIEDRPCWTAPLTLTSWAGYQSRHGPYGSVDGARPSDGRVNVVFAPEGRGTQPLTPAERGLVAWFEAHEPAVSDAVKAAILVWCAPGDTDKLRDGYDESFPTITSQDDLRGLIGLHTIFIRQIETGGPPYIGYEFGCEWDVEHDLGVLMRGTDLVEVGQADTAVLLWIAKADWEKRPKHPAPRTSLTPDAGPPPLRPSRPPAPPGR